jgi:hypothetical protein
LIQLWYSKGVCMSQPENTPPARRQSLFRVFGSVIASMFGVQSSRKHREDFGHGKASTYIAVGLIATILFVLAVWGVVQLVVRVAQPT